MARKKIVSAMDQPIIKRRGYRGFIAKLVRQRWGDGIEIDWRATGPPVDAFINHGRWLVSCPDCGESVFSEPGEGFFCPLCLNEANGGRARLVKFPKDRDEIEAVLLKRINPGNRNWDSRESAAELRAENRKHGIQED